METTIKTTVYAKKLRTRLKTLKEERGAARAAFVKATVKWPRDFVVWVKANAVGRALNAKVSSYEGRRNWNSNKLGFDYEVFFAGAPEPPTLADDDQIRAIQGLLRHLAITGQATVRLTTSDVSKYFGDGKEVR